MNSSIIIPDSHNKWKRVDQILSLENGNYNKVICLGDYLDDFNDTLDDIKETAIWLKNRLDNFPQDIYIVGNHDFAQKYHNNKNAYCSGFTHEKAKVVREILNQDDFNKLKPYYIENGIFYSHAGIDYWFLDMLRQYNTIKINKKYTLKSLDKLLKKLVEQADNFYSIGHAHPLYKAGYNRGGDQAHGSLIWQDFNSHRVLEGIFSIIGHTPCKAPTFKYFKKNELVNINAYGTEEIKLPQQYYCFADQYMTKFDEVDQFLKDGFTLDLDTHLENYITVEKIGVNKNRIKVYKVNFDKVFDRNNPRVERVVTGSNLIFDRAI